LILIVLRFGNLNLDALGGDLNGKKYLIKSLILEELLRDESLVDVNGGFIQVDEGHEEFKDFFYIEPVTLVFNHSRLGNVSIIYKK
jgi:hypothetical protein